MFSAIQQAVRNLHQATTQSDILSNQGGNHGFLTGVSRVNLTAFGGGVGAGRLPGRVMRAMWDKGGR